MGVTVTFVTDVPGSDSVTSVKLVISESKAIEVNTYVHAVELIRSAGFLFHKRLELTSELPCTRACSSSVNVGSLSPSIFFIDSG
jgi:hypothetical protein